ncbi:hypothetical protein U9M48_024059 [Paspalum notatum var. saurae]|uniref:Uncharacterized protein n=1 Tax=Paspalum notatum var. saurae TaxID=547442 RepID=A0AAQ3TQ14_PASNO
MQCRVLNFIELDPPHTGAVIAQAVFDCLVEWKIEDKIMTITLDNANNNDIACCFVVNLVVQDGLLPVDPLISKLRNIVKYFKKSPSRLHKFMDP